MKREVSPTPARYNSAKLCQPFGTWKVRGINDNTEVVDIFEKGKFELLVLTETKLKGKGEVSCSSLPMFMRWKELGKGWPSC